MAKKQQYEFDDELLFDEAKHPFGSVLKKVLEIALLSFAVAVALYGLFAAVVNTDTEIMLKRENRLYAKLYPKLVPQKELLESAVSMLEAKDGDIYSEVFNSTAPVLDPMGLMEHGADTIPDVELVFYTNSKVKSLCADARAVEESFREALLLAADPGKDFPPMAMPIDGISYAQVGASVGSKIDPLYNAHVSHNGVDLIVPRGRTVKATAQGVVARTVKSDKGQGNVVEIRHDGGYVTRYCHLATITVRPNQKVSKGQNIGTVGTSGQTTAPHLHYEVKSGTQWLDPVNCFLADLTCNDYANFLFMGSNTEKSLD